MTPELVADHGLSPDEYERVRRILERDPTLTELGVFSAMWSEHCGYKNSRRLLRLLPTEAPWVIQGPGENAGVIGGSPARGDTTVSVTEVDAVLTRTRPGSRRGR